MEQRRRTLLKPLCYNRDQDMSWAYGSHYQFCDPFSHRIRSRRVATPIYEVISRDELERTEYLNRPGFTGDFSVQNPCDPVKGVPACMEGVLHFPRRSVADGAV